MAFFYRDGNLWVGRKDASSPARRVRDVLPTPWHKPVYVYDLDDVERRYKALDRALAPAEHSIHYAMKANSHPAILARLATLGAGVDTVSGGEVKAALDAGVAAKKIIFSGVAKTAAEIELALSSGIKQINVESPQELERIARIAERLGVVADVALRLNPDVNPKTHPYITTGFRENKFGMDESFMPELVDRLKRDSSRLRLRGLTMHIGSLLFDLGVIREAIEKTIKVHKSLLNDGFRLDRLDIGGGLGIRYETDDDSEEYSLISEYGKMARAATKDLGIELLVEPGRVLVARAGLLVGEVQYIKPVATSGKTFAIVDTGMHHLLRPALYGSKHRILPLSGHDKSRRRSYDVVGPICESSDVIAKSVELPELEQGDLLGIADAGAYGFAMASRYNSHELPHEVIVS